MKSILRVIILIFSSLLLFSNEFLLSEEGFRLIATLSGEKEGDEFCTVCGVGDVNGDGYNDIAVGAREGNYASPEGKKPRMSESG